MVEMSMRERLIGVIERGRDKDHSPETVVDAVLEALREPTKGMAEAANAEAGDLPNWGPYEAVKCFTAMIDHARNDGKE